MPEIYFLSAKDSAEDSAEPNPAQQEVKLLALIFIFNVSLRQYFSQFN